MPKSATAIVIVIVVPIHCPCYNTHSGEASAASAIPDLVGALAPVLHTVHSTPHVVVAVMQPAQRIVEEKEGREGGRPSSYFFERVHTQQASLLSERKEDSNCPSSLRVATTIECVPSRKSMAVMRARAATELAALGRSRGGRSSGANFQIIS